MKLAGNAVAVILTSDGEDLLKRAGVRVVDGRQLVSVEESEDLGIWIRLPREDGLHFFLLRWEYISALDMLRPETGDVGLKGR